MSFAPTEAHVRALFAEMKMFDAMDPDVHWVLTNEEGTCVPGVAMQGAFNSFAEVMDKVIKPLGPRLTGVPKIDVTHVHIAGMTAIVEMKGTATQKNGDPYNNRYCWVLTFSPDTGKIVRVFEYLDSALLRDVVQNNKVEGE
ncbi:hypothetical protein BD626DRAFT_630254 [Schizophyllum amplum]|uniref:SnoaL-like domain-containing protein n=1 Tax=Schizophyllum amplum TaxID=97359 RepID=A0A550CE64_9AGAR|nr:hypothetical protein BD626DRAFT_630254 [Auriculariopsis ampla]